MAALKELDSIEKLLETTGWSCEQLLNKLQEYKSKETPKECRENNDDETNHEKIRDSSSIMNIEKDNVEVDEIESCVILQTKSSSLMTRHEGDDENDNEMVNAAEYTVVDVFENSEESEQIVDIEPLKNSDSSKIYDITKVNPLTCTSITPDDDVYLQENEGESEDNIRNFLKLQLSSLRNKKKTDSCFAELPKKQSQVFHNLKKKRKSEGTFLIDPKEIPFKMKKPDDTLVSLSDETKFVILDVTGGVDRVDEIPNKTKENIEISESSQSAILYEIEEIQKRRASRMSKDEASNSSSFKKTQEKKFDTDSTTDAVRKRHFNVHCKNRTDQDSYAIVTPIDPKIEIKEHAIPECTTFMETGHMKPPLSEISMKNVISAKGDQASSSAKLLKSPNNDVGVKSPFVSDFLDEFLTTKSQLNISYSIPKLRAEEGINKNTINTPYDNFASHIVPHKQKQRSRNKLMKAKTVAEMRRKLENIKRKDEGHKELPPAKVPKRIASRPDAVHLEEQTFRVRTATRNGCIIYNKRLLRVTVNNTAQTMLRIFDNFDQNKSLSPKTSFNIRKPSIFATPSEPTTKVKIQYKPGPLCKKPVLQSEDSLKIWTTELMKLPQIFLEVIPEVGKAINPKFVHLLSHIDDPILTESRIHFAMTALKTKDSVVNTKVFKFPVSYVDNRKKMVVMKRCTKRAPPPPCLGRTTTSDLDTDVRDVINNLINYVEIREISNSLIKDDDGPSYSKNDITTEDIIKRPLPKKKSKLLIELHRLSCKVIDVGNDENGDETCTKPHCKLGCICKSLKCDQIYSNHCQLIECMFQCTCPIDGVVESNDPLSDLNVSHIEDQAKRNLARVEREFTHTIITTDHDAILVGSGLGKSRRATRTPKKYSDFYETESESPQMYKSSAKSPNFKTKKCEVTLKRYNLSEFVPLCLYHKAYNCFCLSKPWVHPISMREEEYQETMSKLRANKKFRYNQTEMNDCARTRPIFYQYLIRSKNLIFQAKLRKRYSPAVQKSDCSEVEVVTPCIIDVDMKKSSKRKQLLKAREFIELPVVKPYAIQRRKLKKKPFVTMNEIIGKSVPKPASVTERNIPNSQLVTDKSPYIPIFPGEIKLCLKDNPEALKIVGQCSENLLYLRILPWRDLIKNFRNGSMKIWALVDNASVLLCNLKDKTPPKKFVSITVIEHRSEIIKWILEDALPRDKPKKSFYVLLKPTKNHFLISGFCVKNDPVTTEKNEEHCKTLDILERYEDGSKISESALLKLLPNKSCVKCIHRNRDNVLKILFLYNKFFEMRTLHDDEGRFYLPLPPLPQCGRWRMIYLNSDFTFLRFRASGYSIKYTDLMDAVQTARNCQRTVTLRNIEFTSGYRHPMFGIFSVPHHQDRLFIGPVMDYEELDIETLRYMHGELITTSVFNDLRGSSDTRNPIWLTEGPIRLPKNHSKPPPPPVSINISDDDDDDKLKEVVPMHDDDESKEVVPMKGDDESKEVVPINDDDSSNPVVELNVDSYDTFSDNLFRPPFVHPFVIDKETKKVNRYIFTNIPNLGYLAAYKYDVNRIEIFMPFADRGYRFNNIAFARSSLIQYFSNLFFRVPETFKIDIMMKIRITKQHQLMKSSYFSNHHRHICGEFGIFNVKNVPISLLSKHGVSSIDALIDFKKQSENNIDNIVHLFGQFLMAPWKLKEMSGATDILKWAEEEICRLKLMNSKYELHKINLEYFMRFNLMKIKELVADLPKEKRRNCYEKIGKIIRPLKNKTSRKILPKQEFGEDVTIEIEDSDEDVEISQQSAIPPSQPSSSSENTAAVDSFQQILKSGKLIGNRFEERSLLKFNKVCPAPSPGQSLLRTPYEVHCFNSLFKIESMVVPTTAKKRDEV